MTAENTPPSRFICPLTREIMHDPVFTRYGHSFERKAILGWLDTVGGICPVTKQKLYLHDIVTNCTLKSEIDDFLSSSPNSSFFEEEEDDLTHLRTARYGSISATALTEETFIAPRLPQMVSSSRMSQNSSLDTQDLAELLNGNILLASSSYRDSRHRQIDPHRNERTYYDKSSLPATKGRHRLAMSSIVHRNAQPTERRANAA